MSSGVVIAAYISGRAVVRMINYCSHVSNCRIEHAVRQGMHGIGSENVYLAKPVFFSNEACRTSLAWGDNVSHHIELGGN